MQLATLVKRPITLGIFLFGDRALGAAMAGISLFTNVANGMWYSTQVCGVWGSIN